MRTLPFALALALGLAGCVQNMAGLKDALDSTQEALHETSVALNETSQAIDATANATNVTRDPPVARLSVFGPNGALLYKSTFQADDPQEVVPVPEKAKLSLIAGDSEALAPGATLTGYAWTLNGKPLDGARQASVEVGEAGLYVVSLLVTDSNGKTDPHTVKLGVPPKPYDVTHEIMTGPIAGGSGAGLSEKHPFTLAADDSKGPTKVLAVVVTASPDLGLDAKLTLFDSEGKVVGEADDVGHDNLDQTESIELGAIPLGDYEVAIEAFAGADPDGVPITITITYVRVIEGLEGDGHAHSH